MGNPLLDKPMLAESNVSLNYAEIIYLVVAYGSHSFCLPNTKSPVRELQNRILLKSEQKEDFSPLLRNSLFRCFNLARIILDNAIKILTRVEFESKEMKACSLVRRLKELLSWYSSKMRYSFH